MANEPPLAPTEARSRIMRAIRSRDTRPEVLVRQLLWKQGYRFTVHAAKLPGRPDIVFTAKRIAILVHGCFWHHHSCQGGRLPTRNIEFWRQKIERNVQRDKHSVESLKEAGWRVLLVWECELAADVGAVVRGLVVEIGPPRTVRRL